MSDDVLELADRLWRGELGSGDYQARSGSAAAARADEALRLAGHLAEIAWLAAPGDPGIGEVRVRSIRLERTRPRRPWRRACSAGRRRNRSPTHRPGAESCAAFGGVPGAVYRSDSHHQNAVSMSLSYSTTLPYQESISGTSSDRLLITASGVASAKVGTSECGMSTARMPTLWAP